MYFQKLKSILYLSLLVMICSCQQQYVNYVAANKYKIGDDSTWAKKEFDDSNWSSSKGNSGGQIFWVRQKMNIHEELKNSNPLCLNVYAFGAYEVYWDGVFIGTNDKPGQEEHSEEQGEVSRFFVIPTELAHQGEHLVALRASQYYHQANDRSIFFMLGNYNELIRGLIIDTVLTHILAGAFLLTAIYFFILYASSNRYFPILLFSICSLLFFSLIIIEYTKNYLYIHYSQFFVRLEIIGILTLFISFLIPLYFSLLFPFPKRKQLMTGYLLLLVGVFFWNHGSYDYTASILGICMWTSAVLMVGYAVFKQNKEAIFVLFGLLANVIIHTLFFYDLSLILSSTILLLTMFYILTLRLKEQRKRYEFAQLQTLRLKNELLKKKIQPHFLMNTLTSLIDWVEESPTQGVSFIEALAQEFKLLNQIEDKTLIPIKKEIQLCKSFLTIMKFRKEISYNWINTQIDESREIPPAIIHTLVENGITHCMPDQNNQITFELNEETSGNSTSYTLKTTAKIRDKKKMSTDGTGHRYVKARLAESFGNKWQFSAQQTATGWENVITIEG